MSMHNRFLRSFEGLTSLARYRARPKPLTF